ncbi:YicC/YloC family endoribonuclease [Acidaminobacter sp.]|uniref:YicC/YloC family endoribonuclease n=1 Tax=Acidaminobacter sp. TaxID=1872102 RepID=UPI00137EA08E|nr:YicC/YloC family endoribonuclease [Acidaminobacter sp.]MDK9709634.1 YicC family protein [Acidaminobacter sp.]MZQ97845.1 YicC family protein [Acidaminobacter sp.]
MTYSMTGYGRGEASSDRIKIVVEIKSVNHRYSEIVAKIPKKMNPFEERIKTMIKDQVQRGRIELYVNYEEQVGADYSILPNDAVLDQYYAALKHLKDRYALRDDVTLSLMSRHPEAFRVEYVEVDGEAIWSVLEKAAAAAIGQMIEMRKTEGAKLVVDILERISQMKSRLEKIESQSPQIVEAYRQKMRDRLTDLLGDMGIQIDEARIAHEIAIFADKTNVTEEIVRLKSHFDQIADIIDQGGAAGRKLDFLVQEMNREVNTIGSKSPDFEISNDVIELKSELEKIREQIQNIE